MLVSRLEIEMDGVALTVFQIIQNGVVAKLIPAAHKLFQPESALLLLRQTALFPEAFKLLI